MPGSYLYGYNYTNNSWVKIACNANGKVITDPSLIFENPPTEDEAKKAATSEWAYDHWKNAAAHHAKYTNLEAQTACNLNGTLYWSCPGIHFNSINPDSDVVIKEFSSSIKAGADNIYFLCACFLPNGATITNVIVYGNPAASDETWIMKRNVLTSEVVVTCANASINTGDSSIDYAVIDNSLYCYYIYTSSLDINDEIWGAQITYTL